MLHRLLLTLLCCLPWLGGAVVTFSPAGSSGDWTVAGNWSPSGVPGSGDTVTIPTGKTAFVSAPQFLQVATLTIDAGGTLDLGQVAGSSTTLRIDSALTVNGTLLIGDGADAYGALELGATQIDGNGSIAVRSAPNLSGLNRSTITLDGDLALGDGINALGITVDADLTGTSSAITISANATLTLAANTNFTLANVASLTNSGTLTSGANARIDFNYGSGGAATFTQTSGGVLNWTAGTSFSLIDSANSATLDGTLSITTPATTFTNGQLATVIQLFSSGGFGNKITTDFATISGSGAGDWQNNFTIAANINVYQFQYSLLTQNLNLTLPATIASGPSPGNDLTLPATTDQGQTVTYTVTKTDNSASQSSIVSGPKLRPSASLGETIKITANAPATSGYAAFSQFYTAVVTQLQNVTFVTPATPATFFYGDQFTLTATGEGGGTASFTSTSAPVSLSGSNNSVCQLIDISSGGVHAFITATVPAAGIYQQGTVTIDLGVIAPRPVTLTVDGGTRAYGAANPTPTATVTTGSFGAGDSLATLGGSTASGSGTTAGATTAPGSYGVNLTFASAPSTYLLTVVPGNLVITKANQTITFPAPAGVLVGGTSTLTATTTSGLPITYTSNDTAIATIGGASSDVATGANAGSTSITASQGGDDNYFAATSVTQPFAVGQLSQSVTFPAIPALNVGQTATLAATADSGLAITYSSSNTAVATISGSILTAIGAGSATITATQAGTINYPAASATSTVTVTKATQTITFPAIAALKVGETGTLAATASSGLAVTYTSSDTTIAQISGTTVVAVGPGTATITATQAGNGTYAAATPVTATLSVGKADQTITFAAPTTSIAVGASSSLGATSSAGLAITYTSSAAAIARISGATVVGVAPGTATITASQAGNANYNPATDVAITVTVVAAPSGTTTGTPEKAPEGGGCGAGSGIALLLGLGAWLGLGLRRRTECSARR